MVGGGLFYYTIKGKYLKNKEEGLVKKTNELENEQIVSETKGELLKKEVERKEKVKAEAKEMTPEEVLDYWNHYINNKDS